MGLDNNIQNTIAGWIWLGTGFVGTYWIGALASDFRRDVGGLWKYFFGPEPGSEARQRFRYLQVRLWGFWAAWLCMYLLLDWLF